MLRRFLIPKKRGGYFRQLECESLQDLIAMSESLVIASGGGIVTKKENMDIMRRMTTIYLELGEEVLFSRLRVEGGGGRPLLRGLNDDQLKSYISDALELRLDHYRQSQFVVDAQDPPNEVASQIGLFLTNKV